MAILSLATAVALTLGVASARKCMNITVPVEISARNGVFNLAAPTSNIEVTDFILNNSQQGHNYTAAILEGYATVSGTYDLATTYCTPDNGTGEVVQLLTHGIGFDRSYWDLSFNNYNYSYAETAVDQYGFSTFSWDRLGIGMSAHGDPISVIQAPLEQAALKALTLMLQAGSIPGVTTKYEKVVHVGHSFGSELTYGLTRDDPTLSAGQVLTGFSQNATFLPFFQLGGNFVSVSESALASEYVDGYFAAGNPSGVQTNFFSPGDFDPKILTLAYMTGQPVSAGELLTIGSEAMGVNKFTGPTLIITGGRDIPYCGGDCLATGNASLPNIPSSSKMYLPDAAPFEVFIVPGAGHGLNLEYTHEVTYQVISQFLVGNGL